MVYPGLPGQSGPPPASHIGQQIRQSTAGRYPGSKTWTTVLDAMGPNAPTAGLTAEANTVIEEVADNPHPIEAENFEADESSPFAFEPDPDFTTPADLTGQGGA
jgi:hypothetical protein